MLVTPEQVVVNYFIYVKGMDINIAMNMYKRDKDKYDYVFTQLGVDFMKEIFTIIMEKGDTDGVYK